MSKYTYTNGVISMVEPVIGSEPVSMYVERIFNIVAIAIRK